MSIVSANELQEILAQVQSDEKIPLSEIMKHILMHYKYGGKTLYYFNTNDQSGEIEVKELLKENPSEETCDSCVL